MSWMEFMFWSKARNCVSTQDDTPTSRSVTLTFDDGSAAVIESNYDGLWGSGEFRPPSVSITESS